jgi:hypothetical protein
MSLTDTDSNINKEEEKYSYLYPNFDDPDFNIKIAERKEFNNTSYDFKVTNVEEEADRLCSLSFELNPHQQFVKNFLSINTPYNSLLLYHGLGTGKTCSAIGISEEMRIYMQQMGITRRIIVVASPNVQENFKLQLFDDRKLEKQNGIWNIEACSGNKYLKEINPINMKDLSKEKIISQVNKIINNFYLFMGYTEFANYISKSARVPEGVDEEAAKRIRQKKLDKAFNNRMIIIDEVHNIRISSETKEKRVATNLLDLVKNVRNMRLLLLSATPMYNSYKEIVWLINLMNINDERNPVNIKEIFDKDGNFILDDEGREIGQDILIEKARGYISFVRGDNPYTFPYRIYPKQFDPPASISQLSYPTKGINDKTILQAIDYLNLFCIKIAPFQYKIYAKIIKNIKDNSKKDKQELPSFDNMEKFGYTMLQAPLEALNIVYPTLNDNLDEVNPRDLIGKEGLSSIMTHRTIKNPPEIYDYDYRPEIEKKFGKIFTLDKIGKYSSKIKNICDNVLNSEGIVLIYSQYLSGGLIPIALALEENGFKKSDSSRPLLKDPSVKITGKAAPRYVMITGDKALSPNNIEAVKNASSKENIHGEQIKVILISQAGSEGLDFKNIRQIHILEPWYNTNRIEQIIGRGVRTCSHMNLPFTKRNVMIFLYGTVLPNKNEAVDMYVYRVAESKAIQIGRVSRVLKQGAVDCLLNKEQMLPTEENINQTYELMLSNKKTIQYKIGDKPYSQLCDYMEKCDYVCRPNKNITEDDIKIDTYTELFILNNDKIKKRVKMLFKERYFYLKADLLKEINIDRTYPLLQIYSALDELINDKNNYLVDKFNRLGYLVNIGEYYLYQPTEISDEHISLFERNRPIDFKRNKLIVSLKEKTMAQELAEIQDPVLSAASSKKSADLREDIVPSVSFSPRKNRQQIERLLANLKESFDKTLEPEKLKRGNYDWYKHCANAVVKLHKGGISKNLLHKFIIAHIVDFLEFDNKLLLLNYLYFKKGADDSEFEKRLKDYLDTKLIKNPEKKLTGIFLQKEKKHQLYILDVKKQMWREAEQTDYNELTGEIKSIITKIIKSLNNVVGFIINFKGGFFVFKTKSFSDKRSKGARCDQAGKNETIKTLNLIIGSEKFTQKIVAGISSIELCCYLELILRYYNHEKSQNKSWFVGPEYSTMIDIENININLK